MMLGIFWLQEDRWDPATKFRVGGALDNDRHEGRVSHTHFWDGGGD